MGNISGMGSTIHMFDVIRKVYESNKEKDVICGLYNIVQPIYMILDPEVCKNVMIKDFNNFVNRGMFVNEEDEPLSGKFQDFFE